MFGVVGTFLSGLLSGGGANGKSALVDAVQTFHVSDENKDVRDASAASDALKQYSAEFLNRGGTWWDSLVDGLNRLVRPSFAFLAIFVLVWPYRNPEEAMAYFKSLEVIPATLWQIIFAIVSFYFVGRFVSKDWREYQSVSNGLDIAREVATLKKGENENQRISALLGADAGTDVASDAMRAIDPSKPVLPAGEYQQNIADASKPMSNKAILEWNRRCDLKRAGA